MLTPDSAQALVEAGASVALVLLVTALLVVGYRFLKAAWDEKSALIKSLTGELAETRKELGRNTDTMAANAAASAAAITSQAAEFAKALDTVSDTFQRELRELTDELRWDQRERRGAAERSKRNPRDP